MSFADLWGKLEKAEILRTKGSQGPTPPVEGAVSATATARQNFTVNRLMKEQGELLKKEPKTAQDYVRLGELSDSLAREISTMQSMNPTGVLGYANITPSTQAPRGGARRRSRRRGNKHRKPKHTRRR